MPKVYLIPCFLAEDAQQTIAPHVLTCIKSCDIIFAENLRSARRYFKALDKNIDIDSFTWFPIQKIEKEQIAAFKNAMQANKTIGIVSEAGCPGIADPGQILVQQAQLCGYPVVPLTGPSSILLALMASGMNGQQFEFCGYLPIDTAERINQIKLLENSSAKNNSTKIFIETPYRNNALFETLVKNCQPNTLLCVAKNITANTESILTKKIAEWKTNAPQLHKELAIFLLYAGTL